MLTYANYRFTLCPTPLDGNGWFNKSHFDVNKWLSSLSSMALLLSQYPNAVAFDLRNELRTNSLDRVSQISDWMKYIPQGMNIIHNAKPDALIFVSGLDYDTDFSFLDKGRNSQEWNNVNAQIRNKIVFEGHIYSWSGYGAITADCSVIMQGFDKKLGWPKMNQRPLVISETGLSVNTFPDNPTDKQFFNCVKRFVVDKKLGFSVWVLDGSYYSRDGVLNNEESFGLLDTKW
jgi:endoglucanase